MLLLSKEIVPFIKSFHSIFSLFNLNISSKTKASFCITSENLKNFLPNNCKKIIVSGSCYEYGKEFGECDEDENMKIKSFFSWAKISLYQYLILKTKENDIDLIWFRIFYVYGSGQRDESLIPFLIKSFTNYETPQIKLPGNKNDFIHIQDVAKAIGNAVHIKSESGIYNLGYGESNSVIDICRLVEKNISKNSDITDRIIVNDKKTDINFWANIEKTKLAFDWEPVVTLKEGIATYFD